MERKGFEERADFKNEFRVFKTQIYSVFSFLEKSFGFKVSSHIFDFKLVRVVKRILIRVKYI